MSLSDSAPPMNAVGRVQVGFTRLDHGADLPLPGYATAGSAGMDLAAAVDGPIVLEPGQRMLVPTALIIHLPPGYEAQVRPRSGLALKHGITCLNAPGTIDQDYRGEVGVILINHGTSPFTIDRGMRIAQLVIAPVSRADLVSTSDHGWREPLHTEEDGRSRGTGGFGSTGTASVPLHGSKNG